MLLVLSPFSSAGAQRFEVIGSTGAVDEADKNIFLFSSAIASIKAGAALPAALDVRYNIPRAEFAAQGLGLDVRYRDNGAGGRVVVSVFQLNLDTGVISNVFSLDSNQFAQSLFFQKRRISSCGPILDLAGILWLEVTITKTSESGIPAFAGAVVSQPTC
jgi:hypothetical protein